MKIKRGILILASIVGIIIIASAITATIGGRVSFEQAMSKKAAKVKKKSAQPATKWNAETQAKELQKKYRPEVEKNIKKAEAGLQDHIIYLERPIWELQRAKDSRALPVLKRILMEHRYASYRKYSAIALRYIKDPDAIPALKEALLDEDYNVKLEAAAALVDFGEKEAAFPVLKEIALKEDHENWPVDYETQITERNHAKKQEQARKGSLPAKALLALDKIGDKESTEIIKRCLNDENSFVRLRASSLLLDKGEKVFALPVLEKIVLNPNITMSVRKAAIAAIVQSSGRKEKKLIEKFIKHPEQEISRRTRKALQLFRGQK